MGGPIQDQYPARAHHGTVTTTPAIIYNVVSIPQALTPPAWLAYPHHVPLPLLSDSTTHKHRKHIVGHNTSPCQYIQTQNISPNKTHKHKTSSFRTAHPTKHTNTKHIILQNISPNKTHKHKTYRPSEHLTQTKHPNTKHIVLQNISPNKTQPRLSIRTYHISTYYILYPSGIFFVIKM